MTMDEYDIRDMLVNEFYFDEEPANWVIRAVENHGKIVTKTKFLERIDILLAELENHNPLEGVSKFLYDCLKDMKTHFIELDLAECVSLDNEITARLGINLVESPSLFCDLYEREFLPFFLPNDNSLVAYEKAFLCMIDFIMLKEEIVTPLLKIFKTIL